MRTSLLPSYPTATAVNIHKLFIRIGLFNGVAHLSRDRTNFRILES